MNYIPLGWAVGILETQFVKQLHRRPARLLLIDPNRATWQDWMIWKSIKEAQRMQQCH